MRKQRFAGMAGLLLAVSVVSTTSAFVTTTVSGTLPNDASWKHFLTTRWTTESLTMPTLSTTLWSGTDQYYYIRDCTTAAPIGSGSPSSPVKAGVGDTAFKMLGPIAINFCFKISGKKDWSWPSGQGDFAGNLRY